MTAKPGKTAPGVSLHNRRVRFVEVAAEAQPDPAPKIAPLRFISTFDGGRKHTVDLRQYPIPGIAKEVARILWTETQPAGRLKSPGSASDAVQAMRRFGEMVVEKQLSHRIRSLSDVTEQHIDDFEGHLYRKYGEASAVPYKRLVPFVSMMKLALSAKLANESIAARLQFASRRGIVGSNKPREPYSPFVAEQLRRAASLDIQNAISRITEEGRALIERGQNPHEFGWLKPENVVWAIAHQGLYAPSLAPKGKQKHLLAFRAHSGTGLTFRDLIRYVHITLDDTVSFMIYLALETGLPIESIDELEFDCLHNEARGYADLRYIKRRRGTGARQVKRVKVDGHLSPGGLIKILKTLTRRTREQMTVAHQSWLFVGHGRSGGGSHGNEVLRRLGPHGDVCTRFCQRHEILGDDGERLKIVTLARLRKTFKAERYVASPGLASVAGDHTRDVHDRHYANVEALRSVHEQTVADALEQALRVAMEPIVIPTRLEGDLATSAEVARAGIGLTATQLETVSSGSQDVWLASCLDHDNSPLQPEGSGPCRSPVWGCLECRNAVITSSKLPALLAFLDHMFERRAHMDLRAWAARYGRAYGRIVENILPRFPRDDIAAARAVASSEGDLMWLPAELTHSR